MIQPLKDICALAGVDPDNVVSIELEWDAYRTPLEVKLKLRPVNEKIALEFSVHGDAWRPDPEVGR